MIQYARCTYPHPNVEYVLGDLLAGPEFELNETRFDKVFCIYTLRLIIRKVDTLRKCYELLKPGGQLIIVRVVIITSLRLRILAVRKLLIPAVKFLLKWQ